MNPLLRPLQARWQILGRQISEFGEHLAVSPLDEVDATILNGLNSIIQLVDADRICWYEVEGQSGSLLHKYTASTPDAPHSPKIVQPGKMPFLADRLRQHGVATIERLCDLPDEGSTDRHFLEALGVKSLLLIPSSYSQLRKGVLGVSSYSIERSWPEESIDQLTIAANIIGATLERKYAQTASQESEQRFRYLFDQASIGIALETLEGRILEVNPALCSMIGYSAEELLSSSCARISHPDDEAIESVLFEELRNAVRSSYRMEKRFFHKDGSLIWGQVNVSLLNTNHGSAPIVLAMVTDVTAQKMAEAAIHQRDRELQQLTRRLIEAQEEERCRISRELHDDIGQRISLLAIEVDLALPRGSEARPELDDSLLLKMHKELDAIATDIHELSHDLHSASLQCCGLEVALKDLCRKYLRNHHLEIDLQTAMLDSSLSPDAGLCLFRVTQEALANVLKHGRTKKVHLKLVQDSEKVRLTVKDFGVGFDRATQTGGIGLISMRERLRFCGGMLFVNSAPGQGTEIIAEVAVTKKQTAAATA